MILKNCRFNIEPRSYMEIPMEILDGNGRIKNYERKIWRIGVWAGHMLILKVIAK